MLKSLNGDRQYGVALLCACALLIGPVFFWILSGRDPAALAADELAEAFLTQLDR